MCKRHKKQSQINEGEKKKKTYTFKTDFGETLECTDQVKTPKSSTEEKKQVSRKKLPMSNKKCQKP